MFFLSHKGGGVPVKLLQSLKVCEKSVASVLLTNKFSGIFPIKFSQPKKAELTVSGVYILMQINYCLNRPHYILQQHYPFPHKV